MCNAWWLKVYHRSSNQSNSYSNYWSHTSQLSYILNIDKFVNKMSYSKARNYLTNFEFWNILWYDICLSLRRITEERTYTFWLEYGCVRGWLYEKCVTSIVTLYSFSYIHIFTFCYFLHAATLVMLWKTHCVQQ